MTLEKTLKSALVIVLATYLINFGLLGWLIGPYDYDHLSAYWEVAWRWWTSSKEWLPGFNPYFCGGRPLGADPQIPIFHPFVILVPLLGPTLLIKLELLMQLALGAYGLHGLFNFFKVSNQGKLWGHFLFLAGGGVVSRFLVGHFTLGFYFLYPLLIFLSYDLTKERSMWNRKLFWYLVLFIYCGLYKPNFLIYGLPPLAVEHLARALQKRDVRILILLGLGVFFCGCANAIVYLPAQLYFSEFPRPDDRATKFIPLYTFLANILIPLKAIPESLYGPHYMQRHEYNQFVGPVGLVFAWLGLKRTRSQPEIKALLIFLLVSLWMGMGASTTEVSAFSIYSWLRPIWPGFNSIRVPVRFWYSATVVLVLFSAIGFSIPKKKWHQNLLLLLGVFPLLANAMINLSKTSFLAQEHQWSYRREYPEQIFWVKDDVEHIYEHIRKGNGVISCVDNIETFQSPNIWEGPITEDKGSGQRAVNFRSWSEMESTTEISELMLNMNHSSLWRITGGESDSTYRENLRIRSDSARFSAKYEVRGVKEGAWVSFITLLALAGLGVAVFRK